jgi:cysteinyl-tRNA synthetase
MLKLYNTLSRKKENFKPRKKTVTLYTCGPTVYDYVHIGNLRTYIFQDILKRTLEINGYRVKHVMNITDIEDKIIKRYKKEKRKSIFDITKPFTRAFLEDTKKLNIKPAEKYPTVTGSLKPINDIIKKLEKNGFAYKGKDGSTYFDISKFKNYGKLARLGGVNLKAGARVSSDEYNKDEVADFVLWKAKKKGEPSWKSSYGEGRPGWHIECSAISTVNLGDSIDIHTGGVDLIFPHHDNEIAQSEGATGKRFVRYWIHGEHLLVDGKKMSKSLRNFYTLKDVEKHGFHPLVFRYLTFTAHYRSKLNFTWEGMVRAERALDGLYREFAMLGVIGGAEKMRSWARISGVYEKKFIRALNDDLNMPRAAAVLWGVIGDKILPPKVKRELLLKFDKVLGLDIKSADKLAKPPAKISKIVNEREKLRVNEQFTKSDALRDRIEKLGYIVEDTPHGPFVWPAKT